MAERTYPYGYKSLHSGGTGGRGMAPPTSQEVSISNRRARVQSKKAYKMLLIGESSVGKTTLAVRLCEDRFMLNPSTKPTLGIDMFEMELAVDRDVLKVQLWDTCGQECYDSITTSYYRGATGIVVTYDITSIRSFQKLVRWFNYIESHATADVPIMLLGTKADLENRREVLVEDGTKYAKEHDIEFFYEVSAKTSMNVQTAFNSFIKEVHKRATEEKRPKEIPAVELVEEKKKCCSSG